MSCCMSENLGLRMENLTLHVAGICLQRGTMVGSDRLNVPAIDNSSY